MSASDDRRSPLGAVGEAVLLGVAGLFVGLLVGILTISLLSAVLQVQGQTMVTNAVSTVAQGAGLLLVGAVYLARYDLPTSYLRVESPSAREVGWAVAATVALFAVLGGLSVLIQQLGLSATEHSVARAAEDNPQLLLPLIPLSVLVTGPAEEFLFRGVIQTRLREVFDVGAAVLVAALVFSLVHIPAYGIGSGLGLSLLTTLGVLFVLGAILGAVYEYTGNLVVPAVAHGLYNAVVFGSTYLEAAGGF